MLYIICAIFAVWRNDNHIKIILKVLYTAIVKKILFVIITHINKPVLVIDDIYCQMGPIYGTQIIGQFIYFYLYCLTAKSFLQRLHTIRRNTSATNV